MAGNADAMLEMASFAADSESARAWFKKSADAGNAIAMRNLGDIYRFGLGTQPDFGTARTSYQKAADGKNSEAMSA